MRYTVSLVVFVYIITAIVDFILGINTPDVLKSYLFRFASAASIMAICMHLASKSKPLRPLIFLLASLVLSAGALTLGQIDLAVSVNTALKIGAVFLTLKPEIMQVEIVTEDEEKQPNLT
jgi:hypothetical protein